MTTRTSGVSGGGWSVRMQRYGGGVWWEVVETNLHVAKVLN